MEVKTWVYHTPAFESDNYNLEMMRYSPWSGHRLFGYDYVSNERPACIVELGSYYGCSAFSFLQAIKDLKLDTEFYGVDTWAGDSFTEHDYQEDIFGQYKHIQDQCFANQNAHMLRMTFDQAMYQFEDASIDMLHIDGSHKYDDVKHDFNTWKRKVKKDGVVFFHDVSDDDLFGEKMGSHIFWEEIKEQYSYTMEFHFSFGLGILFFEKKQYEEIRNSVNWDYYQQRVNSSDVQNKDTIRRNYFEIRDLKKYIQSLKEQVCTGQHHLKQYEVDVKKKDIYISELEEQVRMLTEKCRNTYSDLQDACKEYEGKLKQYEQDMCGKDGYISELQMTIHNYQETVEAKDKYIQELKDTISKYSDTMQQKDAYINELEAKVEGFLKKIQELAAEIERINKEYEQNLQAYEDTVSGKNHYIEELQGTVAEYKQMVEGKDQYISELQETIEQYQNTVQEKEDYIAELKETIEKYRTTVSGKDQYISELLTTVEQLNSRIGEQEATISTLNNSILATEQRLDEALVNVSRCESEITLKESAVKLLETELLKVAASEASNLDKIMILQQELEDIRKTMSDFTSELSRSRYGRHILKRMEIESE